MGNFAFAFWATVYGSYPRVTVAVLTLLVAVPSMYLCESAFSRMVQIKTKSRNRLFDLESDLRCAISKVEPNIEQNKCRHLINPYSVAFFFFFPIN